MNRLTQRVWVPVFLLFVASPLLAASYNASVSGNWSSAATWGGAGVPGSGDSATISGGQTVTLDVAVTVANLTLSNGTITGTQSLNVTSAFNWNGGTISGSGSTTIPSGAVMTVGGVGILDARPLGMAGTLNITSTNFFYLQNNAVLTNTGTVTFQGDGNLYLNGTAGTTAIVNSGTIQKTGGTSGSTLNVPLTANSGSQVVTQSGPLYLADITSTGATFSAGSGATLNFNTSSTRTFDATSTISGAGTVAWSSGTNNVHGTYNVTGATTAGGGTTTIDAPTSVGSLTVNGGTLQLDGATTLSVPALSLTAGILRGAAPITFTAASMAWSGGQIFGTGTITIPSGTAVTVTGIILDQRPVTNGGSILLPSGYFYLENNAVLTNNGTIDYTGDGNLYLNGTAGTTAVINNGTIQKTAGTSSNLSVALTANSGSQLLQQSGTLYVGQVTSTGAAFSVSSGATLDFYYSNTRTFDSASSISGAGTVEWASGTNTVGASYGVTGTTKNSGATTTISNITSTGDLNLTAGTLTLNSAGALTIGTLSGTGGILTGTAPINVTAASMSWSGLTLSGTGAISIPVGTVVSIAATVVDARALTNNGSIVLAGSTYLYLQNNAVLTNNGTIDHQGDSSLYLNGVAGTTAVINNGTIKKSSGTSGSNFTAPLTMQSGSQFLVQSGPMYVGQVVSTGAAFSVSGGATLSFYYSNTRSFDAASTISGAGTVDFPGGTNTVSAAYNVTGTTKNTGAITTISNITSTGDVVLTGGTLTLNGASALSIATLTLSGGTLSGSAPVNVSAATMAWSNTTLSGTGLLTIPNGTTVTLTYCTLDGRPLTNNGTIDITGTAYLYEQNNAVLTNNGTVDLQGDSHVYLNGTAGTTSFVNNATVKKSAGASGSNFTAPLTANSGSQFLVQSGPMYVGQVTSTGAAFSVSGGATLAFYYAYTRTFDAASTISGAGDVEWDNGTNTVSATYNVTGKTKNAGATTTLSNIAALGDLTSTSGTLTLNSASALTVGVLTMTGGIVNGTAPINVTGTSMTWSGGTLGGSGLLSIPAGTTITINGGNPIFDARPVTSAGVVNVQSFYNLYLQNNAVFTNNGTVDVQADGNLYLNSTAGTTAIVNNGTIKKSGGTGSSILNVPLTANSGSQLLVQSAILDVGAVTSTGGAFSVSTGATLNFYYSDTRTFDAASTISGLGTVGWLNGTNTFSGTMSTPLTLTGGTLSINSASAQNIPTLAMSGGTLNGTGNVNLTGASMTWTGGTLGGSGTLSIPAGTTISITGYPILDGKPVSNAGVINLTTTNYLYFQNNAVLTNSGTLDLQSDGSLYLNSVAGTTALVNSGTVKKSGGTGTSTVTVPLSMQSGGQFLLQSGTVVMGAVTSAGGAFSLSSGTTLNFNTGDTRTYDAATTISGAGTAQWQAGTNTFSGTLTAPVTLAGGTLAINSASAQTFPKLTISGGTFTGTANVNLTAASMVWSGGTISGSGTLTIPAGTTVNISGYPTIDARPITNGGSITLTANNYAQLQNNAVLTNNGTIDLQSDASLYLGGVAGSTSIVNNGTLKKSAGAASGSIITVPLVAQSGSQFQVQASTVYIDAITSTGGAFSISSGATLYFYYGATRTFDAASSISGPGTLTVGNGTNTISGTLTAPVSLGNGTLNVNSATPQSISTLNMTGGILGGTGTLNLTGTSMNWSGGTISGTGTLAIAAGTTVNVTGYPIVDAHALNNAGTINFPSGTYAYLQNNAVLTNSGTVDFQTDGASLYLNGTAGTTAVVNNGTIKKSGGTGATTLSVPLTANGGSQLQAQTGTIYLADVAATGATFNAASGATLAFTYGSARTFDAASSLSGAGSLLWQAGTNTVSGTISAATTVSGGTLTINSGSAQSLAALNVSGGTLNGSAALTINGASTWTGGTIGGSGALTIPAAKTVTISGYPFLDARPITVNGTLALTSSFYTYLQNGASLTNNGTIDFQGDGSIFLNTGAASITNNGTIQKSGGTFTSAVGVPITNASAGTLKSASGTLSFTNGLTNSGTLSFPIAGASSFGKINVNGAFALAGTLTVTTTGGYTPSNGTVFQILTFGSSSGAFSGKNLDYSGGSFTESYAPASLSVTAGPQALGISGLSPSRGTSAGGTSVTITGSDFASGATVTFGGLPVTSMTFTNSTSITVVTPAHAPGPVDVVVTNPTTQTATLTNGYTYTGLVANYTFDVAGTPGKDVANGNDATSVTGVTQTAGKVGQAGSFTSGYMSLPAPASLNLRGSDFTLEAWVNSSATTNGNWLTKATASTQQYGLGTTNNTKASFSFDGGAGGTVVSVSNVFDGTWHHVAGVKRGSTIEIWVDGKLEASGPVTGSSDSGSFAVGRNGACCESFDGLIDEARISNYALSTLEIETDALAADLSLTKTAPASATTGQTFSYTLTTTNGGPNAASGVTVTDPLPAGTSFVSATASQGTCSGTTTVTCSLGSLASGANATVTISVTATAAGTITNTATVSALESDPSSANNTASAATAVNPSTCATPTVSASGPTTFCTGGSVTLTASASGAIGYQWYNGANPIGGATGVSYNATASGSYAVKATYANACSATSAAVPVVVNAPPSTPIITPSGPTTFCAGGSVTLTASAAPSWLWSTGATTQSINVTTSGNYTVTITDATGCTAASAPTAVTANPLPNATISAPASACANVSTSASVPANATATFSWTATNAAITNGANSNVVNFTPNGSGNVVLNVTITDANGCTAGNTATVTVGAFTPTVTASGPSSFCAGGSVTLTATTGTSYLWSTGATTQSIVVSTSGNYSVTVTSGACSGTSAPFAVTVYPPPSATITSSGGTTFCAGGSVTLTASAGASWLWSTGATTQSIAVSTSGNYSVTVTSAQGCATTSAPTAITVSPAPAPVIAGPSSVCPGGSVTLDAGAGFTSYSWSTGQTTQTITVSPASTTTYSVTVMNAANCTGNASKTVSVTSAPTPAITAPATVCANSTGNAASTPAVAGATYAWTISGGAITSGAGTNAIAFTAGPSGSVQLGLTVTSGSCSGTAAQAVSITAAPTPVITAPTSVCASSTGNNASTAAIAGASYTWTISGGSITAGAGTPNVTFTAGAAGSVQLGVTVMLSGGCSGSASKSVPITSLGSVTITAPSSVNANSNGNTASVPAGPAGTSYAWTINGGTIATGQGTPSITWSAGTTGPIAIHITVTSGSCTSSGSASVAVKTPVTCNHAAPSLLSPPNTGSVTSPVTFQWSIVNEATSYRLWVAIDGAAAQDVGTTASNALTLPLSGKSFAWFVEALFNGCASTVSPTQTFTMFAASPCAGHGTATLTAPADKSTSASSAVQFQWTSVAQATGYRLWASVDGADFAALGTTTETTLGATIASGTVAWYVQTLFDGCPATESAHLTFTVPKAQSCPSAPATLVAPAANAALHSTSVTFTWNAAPGAIGYELFAALNDAAPSSLGTTTATTLTRDVPPGTLEWFVRTSFNGCPPLDSAHAAFAVSLPPNCSTQRALLVAPADADAQVVSPVGFQWSAVPHAAQYKVWLSQNGGAPQPAGTTSQLRLDAQQLQPGVYDWTVEALFDNGCASTRSGDGSFTVVAPPPPCAPPAVPTVRANSEVSSNVAYAIAWSRIGNASAYEYEESRLSDFSDAAPVSTTSDRVTFQHANTTLAPLVFFYRVRMVSQCDGSKGLFSQPAAVVILPAQSATPQQLTGATPADDPQPVSYTIVLGGNTPGAIPAQPGQTFSASGNQPWIGVAPSSGTVAAGGTTLTVTANTAALPVGTSTGAVTIVLGTPASASRVAPNGATSSSTSTVNVNLVQPSSPTTKNAPPPDALIIPAVAHADGINSRFQSDIRVTNTAALVQKYKITFTPSGDAGSQNGKQTTVSIDPGATLALDDILNAWFGVGSSAQGAIGTLEIRPQSTTSPASPTSPSSGIPSITTFAASRTYNTTANGTYGQYIPAIPFAQFIAAAQAGKPPSILTLQQIAQSDAYRTNFGLVEGSGDPATVLVTIFGDDGSKLAEFTQALAGGQHLQMNGLLASQNLSNVADGRIEVKVVSGGGKVTAYASVVDNATNDPLLVSPVQAGGLGASKWVIPGVADLDNGIANWRSDVRLYNAGASPVDATLTYVPQGGGDLVAKTLTIGPSEIKQLDGILQSLFGITNSGGALHVSTAAPAPLVATARTYNQTANGTYGQFIPAVTPNDAVGKGQRALQILQVEESDRYRSNVGIAEVTGKPATVEITAVPPDSKFAATTTTKLDPNEYRQFGSLLRSMGFGDTYNARVTVRVIDGDGKVTAYASVIDQRTNDPTFVPAQ